MINKSRLVALGLAFSMVATLVNPISAVAAEKIATICSTEGVVSVIDNAETMALNSTSQLTLSSVISGYDESNKPEYSGTIAGAFKITTSKTNDFYKLTYSNPTFAKNVTFAVYNANKTESTLEGTKAVVASGKTASAIVKLAPETTYYVVISADNGSGYATTTASVSVNTVVDDVEDTKEKATEIRLNESYSKNIDGYADVDFFKFTTDKKDAFYYVSLTNTNLSGASIQIQDSEGNVVKTVSANKVGETKEEYVTLAADKTYYAKIVAGKTAETGNYKFSIKCNVDDAADTVVSGSAILVNTVYKKAINGYGDIDCYKVTTDNSKSYFRIDFSNTSVKEATLKFLDSNQKEITAIKCKAGFSDSKYLSLSTNQDYYVVVSGTNAEDLGEYSFQVAQLFDDINDTKTSAFNIAADKKYTYNIQSSDDVDAFVFDTGLYSEYTIVLNNNGKADQLVTCQVKDANGNVIVSGSTKGQNTLNVYKTDLQKNSKYYIYVTGTNEVEYDLTVNHATKNITYVLNGGTNDKKAPMQYTHGTKVDLITPHRNGYKFVGWYTDKDYTKSITSIDETNTDNVTLYAKWEKIKVNAVKKITKSAVKADSAKISWKAVSGDVTGYEIQYSTSSSFKNANTIKTKGVAKTISKLKTNKSYYVRVRAYYTYDGKTYYGAWKKTTLPVKKITYVLDKGTNNKANIATYRVGSTVKLGNPTKKGYKFVGWYTDKTFKTKVTKITNSTNKNITVYARWAKNI